MLNQESLLFLFPLGVLDHQEPVLFFVEADLHFRLLYFVLLDLSAEFVDVGHLLHFFRLGFAFLGRLLAS